MTRKRLLAAAGALAAFASRPKIFAQQQGGEAAPPEAGPETGPENLERRLSAIENVLTQRSTADGTLASRALDLRLTRMEMRMERLEREIWNLRNRVGR
ncbi:MAG: hypothetical protein H6509_00030 [Bryobacterales bacterium]|nr:hypothetical protein [Bryobacterales bacterium]